MLVSRALKTAGMVNLHNWKLYSVFQIQQQKVPYDFNEKLVPHKNILRFDDSEHIRNNCNTFFDEQCGLSFL